MLTENEVKHSLQLFKLASYTRLYFFRYENDRLLHRSWSNLKNILFWTFLMYHIGSLAIVASSIPDAINTKQFKTCVYLGFQSSCVAGSIISKITFRLYKVELIQLINRILLFNSIQGKSYTGSSYKTKSRIRQFIFIMGSYSTWGAYAFYFLFHVVLYDRLPSIPLLIIKKFELGNMYGLFLYILLQCYTYIDFCVTIHLTIITVYICHITFNFWINRACVQWPAQVKGGENCIKDCFGVYRCLFLLITLYNVVFGTYIVPTWKLFAVWALPVGLFFVITLPIDDISIAVLLFINVAGGFMVLIPSAIIMTKLYDIASKIKSNIQPSIQRLNTKMHQSKALKDLKSLPQIRCIVGNFYYMESQAKLTLFDTIVNNLVFLLLAN